MNRWDEIQATARNIASNVHADPAARDAMADELIKLCGLMVAGIGKVVAIDGETAMNDSDDAELDTMSIGYTDAEVAEFEAEKASEHASAYARYLVGERLQTAATQAVADATNPKVNLDRWRAETPSDPCTCRHIPKAHEDGGVCNGERFNGEPCKGGPCNAYVRDEPTGGWVHQDRRPAEVRALQQSNAPCGECGRVSGFGHTVRCSRRKAATPDAVTQPARPCCYTGAGPCATCRNGGPVGRCCFPLRDVCPKHH